MRRFQSYRWPGNVRELRNALETMMVLAEGEVLTERDLPPQAVAGSQEMTHAKEIPTGLTMEELEKLDRKSTRLNSSHAKISYAVFCLHEISPMLWKAF